MKKALTLITMAALLFLILTSVAFAQGTGFGNSQNGFCLRESLTAKQQEQFDKVIETYRDNMLRLREKLQALRIAGDSEGFREAQAERFELMEQKRAALSELLPEEYAERFQSCNQSMRNFGVEKGRSGFGMKSGCNR